MSHFISVIDVDGVFGDEGREVFFYSSLSSSYLRALATRKLKRRLVDYGICPSASISFDCQLSELIPPSEKSVVIERLKFRPFALPKYRWTLIE